MSNGKQNKIRTNLDCVISCEKITEPPKRSPRYFCSLLLLLTLFSFGALAAPGDEFDSDARPRYFDQQAEFPNFFLPEEFRGMPSDRIPVEVINSQQVKVEAALQSIFERLTIPVVPEGSTVTKNVRYFGYVRDHVGKEVQVMPSGGVVRSALGYLYAEMYKGATGIPPISAEEVLNRIIKGTNDISGLKIRGIGSDFDLLVKGEASKVKEAKALILKITNSAETHYDAFDVKGPIKKGIFTIGDVKDYLEQINRSTSQGGATIDFLAFDIEMGKFIQPENHKYIVADFFRGHYRYLPPEGVPQEEPDKQTVRGIRGLLELPFLKVDDESQLRQEIQALIKKLNGGNDLSFKALEQTGKIVRNARFGGAHNRIYRGAPGSLESLILQLNSLIIKRVGAGKYHGIPEFVDGMSVESRNPSRKTELNGISKKLLTSTSDFIRNHSNNGVVYHGSPSFDQAMAIMRGGLFLSGGKNSQGAYVYGSGGYASHDPGVAASYAGVDGLVLELSVKEIPNINILDLNVHGSDPAIQSIRAEATRQGRDFHEVLRRDHGIDIIISGHVLIQNIEAFRVPETPEPMLRALHYKLTHLESALPTLFESYINYRKLYPYAVAIGLDLPPPPHPEHFIEILANRHSLEEIARVFNTTVQGQRLLNRALIANPQLKERFLSILPSLYESIGIPTWYPWEAHEFRAVVTDLLINHTGSNLSVKAAEALANAIEAGGAERKDLVSAPMLEGLKANLILDPIELHEGQKVYSAYGLKATAAIKSVSALKLAIRVHPNDKTLVSSDLLSALKTALEKNNHDRGYWEGIEIIKEIAKSHGTEPGVQSFVIDLAGSIPATTGRALSDALKADPHSIGVPMLIVGVMNRYPGTSAAADGASALGAVIADHPDVKSLVAKNVLDALKDNLTQHYGSEAEKAAKKTLEHVIQLHFNDRAVLSLFEDLFVNHYESYARNTALQLSKILIEHPDDPAILALVEKLAMEHAGTPVGSVALSFIKQAIEKHPLERTLISPKIIEAIRKNLDEFVDAKGSLAYGSAAGVLGQSIKAHPKDKALIEADLIDKLVTALSHHSGNENGVRMNEVAAALEAAIATHPEDKSLIGPPVIEAIRKNLPESGGPGPLSALSLLGTALRMHPEESALFSPELLHGIENAISNCRYADQDKIRERVLIELIRARHDGAVIGLFERIFSSRTKDVATRALAKAISEYPNEAGPFDFFKRLLSDSNVQNANLAGEILWRAIYSKPEVKALVSRELLAIVTKQITENDWSSTSKLHWALSQALKAHPADVLLAEVPGLVEIIGTYGDLRKTALESLFYRRDPKELVRVVRSGKVPFVNEALAERVRDTIPPAVLEIPNSRKARQSLPAPETGTNDCERVFQLLYLQYGRNAN